MNQETIQRRRSQNKYFNDFCFWFITIDILFLPYLSFMAVSVSVPVVVIWAILNVRNCYFDYEWSLFIIMLVIMAFGTIMPLFFTGTVRFETTIGTAVKRFFQYAICFYSYFFYKDYFSKKRINLYKIIVAAVIFIAIFAVFYRLFPHQYATLKIAINPVDNHTRRYLSNMVEYRFNYLWTDPNNISYLIAGIVTWFLLQEKPKMITKSLMIVLSIFIAFCTVSNGGLIILMAMLCLIFAYTLKVMQDNNWKISKNALITIIIIMVAGIIIWNFSSIKEIISNNYISKFASRLGFYSNHSSNRMGGRLEDLKEGLRILSPQTLILGTGQEGIVTEIGHIYWIGMYGVPAYLIFLRLMFKKYSNQSWKSYLWIVPFFMGFTMNIAIGEYKWMAIYLMLLAYSRTENVKITSKDRFNFGC